MAVLPADPDPLELPAAPFTIDFAGRRVAVVPGQSVAAALVAAGVRSWRTTRAGRPRGLFCGIGVCFDCLVTLNGRASVRACTVIARPGDRIAPGGAGPAAPAQPAEEQGHAP